MTTYETIAVILSVLSIIIAIISIVTAVISNNKTSKLQQGQVELEISKYITDTKNKVLELSLHKSDYEDKEIYTQAVKTAIENNLNAYEEACSKYIDGKIDKLRFKKNIYG